MYVGRDWDDIEPGETDTFTLELTADLRPGQTISNPVWSCQVVKTLTGLPVDTTPANRISGQPTVTTQCVSGKTRTYTNQMITGMMAGNDYLLEATVQADDRTLKRYSFVRCRSASR